MNDARADRLATKRTTHLLLIGAVLCIVANDPVTARGAETTLIAPGATWKYLDDGSDQGTAWSGRVFADGGWASGPAELGYGDGDEATVVSFGGDPALKRHRHQADPSPDQILARGDLPIPGQPLSCA